jgi:CheY-like chemotaxis protein
MDVLLVEDEELAREAAAEALRHAGLEVAEAATAEEALRIAEADGDGPKVVVTDLRLGPGMDGLTLGAEALRRWARIGVVYATGNPQEFDGRLLGPTERYVVKPYTPANLLQAVRRAMA